MRADGRLIHGDDTLYEEVVHVPLIIHNERLFPRTERVGALVESIDIFPTIIDLAGLSGGPGLEGGQLQGLSIRQASRGTAALAESHRRKRMRVTYKDWSYLLNPATGETELYDLSADSKETKNLAKAESVTARKLARLLARKIAESGELGRRIIPQDAALDAATEQALRSLGYIR